MKKKISYLVEGFSSKEEREEFRNKITVLRGKTGKTVVEVLIEAVNKYEEVERLQQQLAELKKQALNKYADVSAADLVKKYEAVERQNIS